jgi:Leucine-rich repeat (LRR) protein
MKTQLVITIAIIMLILGNGTFSDVEGAIPAAERTALIDLYNSNGGDDWLYNAGWKTPPLDVDGFAMPGTERSWYGVTVVSDTVTMIDLNANRLTGDIQSSISNLTSLTWLTLSNNDLTSLPPEIGNLTNLTSLLLESNQLTSIPSEIGNLTSLTELNLECNQLTFLPPEILNLVALTVLNVRYNQLCNLDSEMDAFLVSLDPNYYESQNCDGDGGCGDGDGDGDGGSDGDGGGGGGGGCLIDALGY